jgi:hypothetical protein
MRDCLVGQEDRKHNDRCIIRSQPAHRRAIAAGEEASGYLDEVDLSSHAAVASLWHDCALADAQSAASTAHGEVTFLFPLVFS